ncbi:MBL fold metallo-hydrolase [Thiobacillus sp.]|jgi:glyoxylase-like metal-dependent hydrolase (beta-lactamase superfamily II)|uniref:MBL fold metallo-hydrolase n=1 Tax=Thiobacillus sp. TaxID=924 RepID=UPI0025FF8563|nr:MBL fold metallo-hydrolase [Thiobacillus sp.]
MRALFTPLLIVLALMTPVAQAFQLKAEHVVDNVYALIGPLGQRSVDNDGLNANFGFVVTPEGVILIDSGASRLGAEKIAAAIGEMTDKPVRWVVNTGSQDHRWLGNAFFAEKGAEVIALTRTAAAQAEFATRHIASMKRFLGARMQGTRPLPAPDTLAGNSATLELGGETLVLAYTDAHFPGDAWVWLPKRRVMFSGDLVFVDRLLGVLRWSSVRNGQQAFRALAALQPAHIVPGHGRVCDLAQAQRETGDYYDFLATKVGAAAREMEPMEATLDRYADLPAFSRLENYGDLHRANMNRAFTEFESQ